MKPVHYRGQLVTFEIPDHWVTQADPEDGGIYFDPADEAITLRLHVLTLESPHDLSRDDAHKVLQAACGDPTLVGEPQGPGQVFAELPLHATEERGHALELHRYGVARVVPPRLARIAMFTTTVVTDRTSPDRAREVLTLIRQCLRTATVSDAAPDNRPKALWKRLLGM